MVMGIESLSVGEFHQMLGRAGRPGYHERGKVYLLVDPLKQARGESEDTIAFSLLDGTVEDVEVELDDERELEELLACIATGHTPLSEFNEHALWPLPLEKVQVLEQHGMVRKGSLTQLGRAVSSSFLSVKEAMRIRASMRKDPLDIVVELLPYESVYLSQGLHSMLKTGSFRLFSGEVLEKLENADSVSRLPSQGREMILKIMMAFFACDCGDPFCEHPAQEFARLVLDLRMSGMSPRAISAHFGKEYDLLLYAGDIFSYLDQTVHKLEAVGRIASAMGQSEVVSRVRTLSKKIEG
jgi:helicase